MLLSVKLGKFRQTFWNLALELDRVGAWYQRERGNNPCFERLRLPEERTDLRRNPIFGDPVSPHVCRVELDQGAPGRPLTTAAIEICVRDRW
ncbi:MAG: hypothetical protein ACXVUE_10685 [Solirubrobacteraceae bacterium]